MRERPILFRGAMVKAILEGRKSMTRRVVKPQPFEVSPRLGKTPGLIRVREADPTLSTFGTACPYGKPGDRLWVRETWKAWEDPNTLIDGIVFQADGAFQEIENTLEAAVLWAEAAHRKPAKSDWKPVRAAGQGHLCVAARKKHIGWRPSIFMPRWACRLVLEITDVRVERLNDITSEDAIAEGIERNAEDQWKHYLKPKFGPSPVHSYRTLWESINGVGSWGANPWIWVIEFKRLNVKGGA